MADNKAQARPLSPHLQIYRPMLTMVLSILHRITGGVLYLGIILLVWWLTAAATSDAYYAIVQGFFGHWFGRLVLLGFSLSLIYHTLGGIKHLLWDTGHVIDKTQIEWLARLHVGATIVITLGLWLVAYGVRS